MACKECFLPQFKDSFLSSITSLSGSGMSTNILTIAWRKLTFISSSIPANSFSITLAILLMIWTCVFSFNSSSFVFKWFAISLVFLFFFGMHYVTIQVLSLLPHQFGCIPIRWLSVRQQLYLGFAVLVFKCMMGCTPEYLTSRLIRRSAISTRTTRNYQLLGIPLFRTASSQRIF